MLVSYIVSRTIDHSLVSSLDNNNSIIPRDWSSRSVDMEGAGTGVQGGHLDLVLRALLVRRSFDLSVRGLL